MTKKIVMVIAFRGFRDPEYFIPRLVFERADLDVKVASNKKGIAIGAEGGEADVDMVVSEVNVDDFDAIIFIGGPGCLMNLDNQDSYKLAKDTVTKQKILASICIAPTILAKAGVLKGKKATVWTSPMDKKAAKILEQYGANYVQESVVSDDNIVTGDGPGAALEFGEKIVKYLTK